MKRSYIIAAARKVDGRGDLSSTEATWADLQRSGARLAELTIDPLESGWDTPVLPGHFRSGCAPIEALAQADAMVRAGTADAVRIRGCDLLRSRYSGDKATRQRLMSIYECSIPEAYNQLAHAFIQRHGFDEARFKTLAAHLHENYIRTARRNGQELQEKPEFREFITDLFRGVDCANPVVDFEGEVIVSGQCTETGIAILGVGLGRTPSDGPAAIEEIVTYAHLQEAYEEACATAQVDFAEEFLSGRALLEAYTCYPVVPLGFLLASGIAQNLEAVPEILAKHEVTVTGGMNLARAAWNNPALQALIVMVERLRAGEQSIGGVQGNGGLGYRQGFALLGRE